MYEGFQRYGGAEVVNHERLAAYVAHGLAPTGLTVEVPEVCEGLAGVLTADGEYRTPLQDQAPWVDNNDPDTWDFAGVLSLEVTGVDNTTRTVDMTPTLRDGALPGRARRGPRTVAQTALLVGRTTEGVQAGLAWLTRTLHGACDQSDASCGPAATLEVITACPGPIVPTVNTQFPPLVTNYRSPRALDAPTYDWTAVGGTFDTASYDIDGPSGDRAASGTVLLPYPPEGYDGGTITTEPTDPPLDGGGAAPLDLVINGGDAGPLPGAALLTGPGGMCTTGPVSITWRMRDQGPVTGAVQLVLVDDSGVAVEFGPKVDLTDALDDYVWDLPFGIGIDTWRPGITAAYPVVVQSLTLSVFTDNSPMDCVTPYQRFLPATVTVAGPTVVQEVDAGCAVLLKVEWTWVTSPYRYSPTTTVLAGLSADTDAALALPGVSWTRLVASDLVVINDGSDASVWSTPPPGRVAGSIYGAVYVVSSSDGPPTATLTTPIDTTTRRYVAVTWQQSGNVPGTVPSLQVRAPGSSTLLPADLVRSDPTSDPTRTRSVFLLPTALGAQADALVWTGTGVAPPGQVATTVFDRVTIADTQADDATTTSAAPWNCAPPAPALSCATDPCSPGFAAPPRLPFVVDPARPRITTQQVRDLTVCIGPEQTPANDGVLTITLAAADQPIVGARVRVWDTTEGDCTVPDVCDFAYEYLVDYIPAGGVLTIDGVDGTITTLCDGGNVLADATGSVAGAYGGPTTDPVARCGRRYLLRVQWLATYPRDCGPLYAAGEAQGDLTLTVGVTDREG